MKIRWIHVLATLAAAAAVAAVATGAFAVTGSTLAATEGVITACKHPNGGWIRVVADSSACRTREQAISWNAAGTSGGGVTKLSDLSGIACTTEAGAAGKVELDFAGDDTVLFRCVGSSNPPPPGPASKLVINEVDYDQVGADGAGFVEIKNTGTAAAPLTGINLVFVDGADSEEYRHESLTGTLAPGGYLVVAVDPQNGSPDGLAIVDTSDGALIDALSYEGPITNALIGTKRYNLVEGTVLPTNVADSNTVEGSLIRNPDGKDTNNAAADWVFTKTLTRGAANIASN